MKFGYRKPSFKKSFKARTTGKWKRQAKKAIIPGYGSKGVGWVKNPKKSMYNTVYNKTTKSIFDSNKVNRKKHSTKPNKFNTQIINYPKGSYQHKIKKEIENEKIGFAPVIIGTIISFFIFNFFGAIIALIILLIGRYEHNKKPKNEIVDITVKLNKKEIEDINEEYLSLVNYCSNSSRLLASTTNADIFFENIKKYEDSINKAYSMKTKYNIPLLDNLKDLRETFFNTKNDLILNFINNYYIKEEKSASKLKTLKGYKNRLNNKKDNILKYKNYLSDSQIIFLDNLWKKSKFK